MRCILSPKHQRAGNTTNAAKTNKRSTGKRTLPLATDVVCLYQRSVSRSQKPEVIYLISHYGGEIGRSAAGDKEDGKVPGCTAFGVSLRGCQLEV